MTFDVELLGDCDAIITEMCQRLGGTWNNLLEGVEIPDVKRRPCALCRVMKKTRRERCIKGLILKKNSAVNRYMLSTTELTYAI